METRGRIVAIADGIANVEVAAVSACGSCRSRGHCGTGDTQVVRIEAGAGMCPGDEIALQMEDTTLAAGALAGYLMPALTTLAGAALGSTLYGGDAAAALGAGAGLAIGIAVLNVLTRFAFRGKLQPTACGTVPHPTTGDRP